ncbi:MAG: hypothetical protein U0797_09540 [Gemmataceae bacterium]
MSSWLAVKATRAEAEAEGRRIEAEENAQRADYNAGAFQGAMLAANEMQIDAEQTSLSLQVDLDLMELRQDPQIALLRLCRTRKVIAEKLERFKNLDTMRPTDELARATQDLDEFITAAILAVGQDYAPLLPPITHEGTMVLHHELSPDFRTLLTLGQDGTCRLWDVRAARQIAVLRQASERVMSCGFSPDGQSVCTDDLAGLVRIWNSPAGTYRAQTEPRKGRYQDPSLRASGACVLGALSLAGNRVLTGGRPAAFRREEATGSVDLKGPIELWDTASGRLVARLDGPGRDAGAFRLPRGGRWVTTVEQKSTVLVFSADTGELVKRLAHPTNEGVRFVLASPTGRRVATVTHDDGNNDSHLRIWDAAAWRLEKSIRLPKKLSADCEYWTDDLIGFQEVTALLTGGDWLVYRHGCDEPFFRVPNDVSIPLLPLGELILANQGQVFDVKTGKRLTPPAGRQFHPALARFAADERFVITGSELCDVRVDKSIAFSGGHGNPRRDGFITAIRSWQDSLDIRHIPTAAWKGISADFLELWTQVAVRGDLDPEGVFVKWKEEAWEMKRRELAARPAPWPNVPFPGHVAQDRLHWLREEFRSQNGADQRSLATKLLRRAETFGVKSEAVRWRAWLARNSPEPSTGK